MGLSNNEMEATLAFAWYLRPKITSLGGVLEESWRRPGGVSEPSLGVFEESEACVRTSKGGKAMLGKHLSVFVTGLAMCWGS